MSSYSYSIVIKYMQIKSQMRLHFIAIRGAEKWVIQVQVKRSDDKNIVCCLLEFKFTRVCMNIGSLP